MTESPEMKVRYIYPRWHREKGAVWTAIGRPGEVDETIVGPGGEIQPWNTSYSVSFWVYDRDRRALYAPEEIPMEKFQWRLMDGYLPITISTWQAGDVTVEVTNSSGTTAASKVKISNSGKEKRRLYLYTVIRPHGVGSRYFAINSLKFAGGAAYINGRRAIEPMSLEYDSGASQSATSGIEGDISFFASDGKLPDKQEANAPATGAFRYDLALEQGKSQEYGFVYAGSNAGDAPIVVGDVKPDDLIQEAAGFWKSLFAKTIEIEVPDKHMQECFYASLAYLLILQDGPFVVPGPLNYNSVWVRDAAYVVDALMKSGLQHEADQTINSLIKLLRQDGMMPPVFNMGLQSLNRREWDSQGQLIYMIAQRYRLTRDLEMLASQYPAVGQACVFIHATRKRNLQPELEGTPFYGIMPPSLSAEDIGDEGWHHYWDDFWCIYGLQEASAMAKALGKRVDGDWMAKDAEQLKESTFKSIKAASGGLHWIPNGPEDTKSSSAARGTTAGVWPTGVLSSGQAKPAFDAYWAKWVEPHGGGFMHNDKFWPYATLSLAHAYFWNGDNEKAHSMLKWTLENQTAPGVYAWSEVVDPKNMRFGGGDMPHGWGAAEYILLLRDLLIRDDKEHIVLLSGVPEDWLKDGNVVRVKNAPAHGQIVGFEARGNLEKDKVEVKLTGAALPVVPVEVRLPSAKSGAALLPNGDVLPVTKGSFVFPKDVSSVVIMLGETTGDSDQSSIISNKKQ